MAERTHILGLTRDELADELAGLRLPVFRADQVRDWVFAKRCETFDAMTNLARGDRIRLAERFDISTSRVVREQRAHDEVRKLLLAWPDEATTEAVLIPSNDASERLTACISSQVGCPVGCRFCASGIGGLVRNLSAGQIVEQAWRLTTLLAPDERLSNIVFMGLGEPLANYDAVLKAVRLINASDGLNVGQRKITVSTIGIPAQIRKLAEEDLQITLAISLHAPNQTLRASLIPWARNIPLNDVLEAARLYFARTGREITFEYCLLAGANDSVELADQLADLAHTVRCNVNLLYYNPVADLGYDRPEQAAMHAFRDRLVKRGVNVHIRRSRGLDIDAACGQLRRRHEAGEPEA
ncbi:MAG: putative dual-specificity RNA methyltransferase RlmN [Phycisphaerae bacterium]|nr:putative dual-specificity RNA methyltransferase RlmN [Phycisphaerae bacterium]